MVITIFVCDGLVYLTMMTDDFNYLKMDHKRISDTKKQLEIVHGPKERLKYLIASCLSWWFFLGIEFLEEH